MNNTYTVILLVLALVLPIVGAIALRWLLPRLAAAQVTALGIAIFALAAASALTLGHGEIDTLRIGGLTLFDPSLGVPQEELEQALGGALTPQGLPAPLATAVTAATAKIGRAHV